MVLADAHERRHFDVGPVPTVSDDVTGLRQEHEAKDLRVSGVHALVRGDLGLGSQWGGGIRAEQEPVLTERSPPGAKPTARRRCDRGSVDHFRPRRLAFLVRADRPRPTSRWTVS